VTPRTLQPLATLPSRHYDSTLPHPRRLVEENERARRHRVLRRLKLPAQGRRSGGRAYPGVPGRERPARPIVRWAVRGVRGRPAGVFQGGDAPPCRAGWSRPTDSGAKRQGL